MSLDQLVPEVSTMKIGKKVLEEKEILPLSFIDQKKVLNVISSVISTSVSKWRELPQEEMVEDFKNTIVDNIELFVSLVYEGDKEEFLNKMTNMQMIQLADIIWRVNFESPLEEGKKLFQKIATSLKTQ